MDIYRVFEHSLLLFFTFFCLVTERMLGCMLVVETSMPYTQNDNIACVMFK